MKKQAVHCAVVGFANAGKSSLYNRFSGHKQYVSNWNGATVGLASKVVEVNNMLLTITDLPGIAALVETKSCDGFDEQVTHAFLRETSLDVIINVVDATQLSRQLPLTISLREQSIPMLVVLTKTDCAQAPTIDSQTLASQLGCPVIPQSNNIGDDIQVIVKQITYVNSLRHWPTFSTPLTSELAERFGNKPVTEIEAAVVQEHVTIDASLCITKIAKCRQVYVNNLLETVCKQPDHKHGFTQILDSVALNNIFGIPLFLGAMYCLFMFAINVGGAFIDFFDIVTANLLVEWPVYWIQQFRAPELLIAAVQGLGMGAQTVATFIPLIACMFIGLTILEQSGYLARAAFVVDGLMQKIGLPGKSFVPLIVGFGCNVPAIMATRVLSSQRERITTAMLAPFMSCGARLPVYALFAAVFFPDSGQNIVFALYLIGIACAIVTGLFLKHTLLPGNAAHSVFELPQYQLPSLRDILYRMWRRTSSFILGAGKVIIVFVCILNLFNSINLSGEFLDENNKHNSIIAESAKTITPLLAPMGVKESNWQATVGIISGLFAKEVLVATLDNLYSPTSITDSKPLTPADSFIHALRTISNNVLDIRPDDPVGISIDSFVDLSVSAKIQGVELYTYENMRNEFVGKLGAFSYLLFILLYTPCAAVLGVMKQEFGIKWAVFSATWCLFFAYQMAVLCYQIGMLTKTPAISLTWIAAVLASFLTAFLILKLAGKNNNDLDVVVTYR